MFSVVYLINEKNTNKNREIEDLSRFPEENINPVFRISKEMVLLYANASAMQFLTLDQVKIGDIIPKKWHDSLNNAWKTEKVSKVEQEINGVILMFIRVPVIRKG